MQATRPAPEPGTEPGNPGTDPGNPGTDPGNPGTEPGSWSVPQTGEEFLARFGDAIDDRVGEILDELLEERRAAGQPRRLPWLIVTICLAAALAAILVLAL
jgi:hypothetical protein